MSANNLLARLENVRRTGHNKWIASCPAHEDRSPSLAVREKNDGCVLLYCFAGCSTLSVITKVGLEWSELYPEKSPPVEGCRPVVRSFLPADAFNTVRHELHVVGIIVDDFMKHGRLSPENRQRIIEAESRIEAIKDRCYGNR